MVPRGDVCKHAWRGESWALTIGSRRKAVREACKMLAMMLLSPDGDSGQHCLPPTQSSCSPAPQCLWAAHSRASPRGCGLRGGPGHTPQGGRTAESPRPAPPEDGERVRRGASAEPASPRPCVRRRPVSAVPARRRVRVRTREPRSPGAATTAAAAVRHRPGPRARRPPPALSRPARRAAQAALSCGRGAASSAKPGLGREGGDRPPPQRRTSQSWGRV